MCTTVESEAVGSNGKSFNLCSVWWYDWYK